MDVSGPEIPWLRIRGSYESTDVKTVVKVVINHSLNFGILEFTRSPQPNKMFWIFNPHPQLHGHYLATFRFARWRLHKFNPSSRLSTVWYGVILRREAHVVADNFGLASRCATDSIPLVWYL
jgi:hypothetical protein